MKISASELDLYQRCPRAYKLNKFDEVIPQKKSLSLCKAITAKKTIHRLHGKGIGQVSQEEIEKICEEIWKEEISDPRVEQQELNEIILVAKPATKSKAAIPSITKAQKILDMIKSWCVAYAKQEKNSNVLYSNISFEDMIGDTVFTGNIDQIRKTSDSGICAIMFKTSSQPPCANYLARDFSLSLMAHAVWQGKLFTKEGEEIRLQTIPELFVYYLPYLEQKKNGKPKKDECKNNLLICATRAKEALLDFEYELLQVASGIEMKFFPMRVTHPVGCQICEFAYQCKNGVSLPDVQSAQYATSLEV